MQDKAFVSTFPELEKQFMYYNGLKEKEKSPGGCSNCTLNKIKATELKVSQTISNDAAYYKRLEAFLSSKGSPKPTEAAPLNKPVIDEDYIELKKTVAENFSKFPVSKIQFIAAMRKPELRKYVLAVKELNEFATALFEEFGEDTVVSHSLKLQIDNFYDLIWAELKLVTAFHAEYTKHIKPPEPVAVPNRLRQKVTLMEASSVEELTNKVNEFLSSNVAQSVSTSKTTNQYIATILHRQ